MPNWNDPVTLSSSSTLGSECADPVSKNRILRIPSPQEQNTRVDKLNNDMTNGMRDFEKHLGKMEPQLDRQKDLIDNLKEDRDRHQNDMRNLKSKLDDLENALRR